MRAHAGVADVAHYGCWALANIAVLPAGKQACVDVGAPATIVAAMRAHAGVADVARLGCQALANIADSASGKSVVVVAGGFEVVTSAMARHEPARALGAIALGRLR